MKNYQASDFVDKCTARLHFERNGVKIYEKVLSKCPEKFKGRFQKILNEEKKHVAMLEELLMQRGANPYAVTPSAKVIDIESKSFAKAANKTDFRELMDTVLSIELVDTVNWEILALMAKKIGDRDAKVKFKRALREEMKHLKFIHRHVLKDLTGSTKTLRFKSRKAA